MKKLEAEKVTPLAPPIKWAGGKRWLAPEIAKLFHESGAKRLVEPFCGACSVALHIRPQRAVLNDINRHLMIFWWYLQTGEPLLDLGGNNAEDFARVRESFNAITFPIDKSQAQTVASMFYYLNRTSFNGLFRVNKDGKYNVPFGKYSKISYQFEWPEIVKAIQSWTFENGDYIGMKPKATDFVYADPPYDSTFTDFAAGGFNWSEQLELALWLSKLPGMVVASNAATPRIKNLYKDLGFTVKVIDAPRRISSDGNRENAKEIFAIKNKK